MQMKMIPVLQGISQKQQQQANNVLIKDIPSYDGKTPDTFMNQF